VQKEQDLGMPVGQRAAPRLSARANFEGGRLGEVELCIDRLIGA
jgi:hypothetical protein